MDNTISMIWADGDARGSAFPDYGFVGDLGTDYLVAFSGRSYGEPEASVETFFTKNTDTMRRRCRMFFELLNNFELYSGLSDSFSKLSEICALKKEKPAARGTNEAMLYSVKELEMYVDFIESTVGLFSSHKVGSEALGALCAAVTDIRQSEEFAALRVEVKKQSHTIMNAKSVTIGVNLDAQLRPLEAGVVKVNEERFRSGEFIDKLLRLDFANDEFTCAAQLLPVDKKLTESELAVLRASLNGALGRIFSGALGAWEKTVRKYVVGSLDALFPLIAEWQFVDACMKSLIRLKSAGLPLCEPQIGSADDAAGVYDPVFYMKTGRYAVRNDVGFGEACVYILTGPNQGGKSVFTKSVGVLYSMLHLGMPIAAESASLRPIDGIFTHFGDDADRSYRNGRLAGECEAIGRINEMLTGESLFLYDEALSSTSADEAIVLSEEILSAYAEIGARGIFTTHLHGLCALEERCGRVRNLTAALDGESHDRTYKIVKGALYGRSYALDIAMRFRLTKDEILSLQKAGKQ